MITPHFRTNWAGCLALASLLLISLAILPAEEPPGEIRLEVSDASGNALPCRIHLNDAAGKAQQAPDRPFWRDHFVCDGRVALKLSPGRYRYEIERGPEWQRVTGTLELKAGRDHTLAVQLQRIADMAAEGWFSGDLHVHRPVKDIELLMRAEDLHVAPVITWWNERNSWAKEPLPEQVLHRFDSNRFYHVMVGEDERGGGALLYFHRDKPLPITGSAREFPSPMKFVAEARKDKGIWIDIEKPFWWDVPVWLASGQVDSIGIAHNHMWRGGVYQNEAWGKPRDPKEWPAPEGNGRWSQEIYYHALNCGLRLPPSAGSASGVLPNPVGYNRVYVHTGKDLSWESWWDGLKAGRSFVTNGPLLLCTAGGEKPGHVFTADRGKTVEIDVQVSLIGNDPIRAIEVVKDGQVIAANKVGKRSFNGGVGKVSFTESGWFLVRVIADAPNTFRFASTAPFYVEIGPDKRPIRKRSARFFLDWAKERSADVAKKLDDPDQRRAVLEHHEKAVRFWQDLLDRAKD